MRFQDQSILGLDQSFFHQSILGTPPPQVEMSCGCRSLVGGANLLIRLGE